MWTVLDLVMGVVTTETHGSSLVRMLAWALRLVIEVTLDAGIELCILVIATVLKREPLTLCFLIDVVLDVGLKLRVW